MRRLSLTNTHTHTLSLPPSRSFAASHARVRARSLSLSSLSLTNSSTASACGARARSVLHSFKEFIALANLKIEFVQCVTCFGVARYICANSLEALDSVVYIVAPFVWFWRC